MSDKINIITTEIEADQNNPRLYEKRASLNFEKRKYVHCIDDCIKAIEIDNKSSYAYSLMAYAFFRTKDYDHALLHAQTALIYDGLCSLAYCVLGNIYAEKNKDFPRALESYNKAIEIDNSYIAYNCRGYLYLNDLFEYDAALLDFSKAIEINNKYDIAYVNRGNLYADHYEFFDKALLDYNMAIELNDSDILAYNNRGVLYEYNLIEYEKALADYSKAIEIDSTDPLAYNNRGNLYARHYKDYKKALNDYNRAIELNNCDPDAYYNRASLYIDIKDYEKALQDFIKSKELYQDNNFMIRNIDGKIQEINGLQSKSNSANFRIKRLMETISESGIEEGIRKTKESYIEFISEKKSPPIKECAEFIILRRWNSYTPIIAENYHISKGGGYFFRLPDCGIVIDPGFNFIDNFKTYGLRFNEIDHVLITHAHNDHTTDLESILTLLHQYNETILGDFDDPHKNTIMQEILNDYKENVLESDRKAIETLAREKFASSPRRKRLRIYMSTSTYKKYAPILDLFQNSDYDVVLIKAEDKLPMISPCSLSKELVNDLEITALYAKHDDLLSNRDSLGFLIQYKNFVLIYTGDTGYSPEIEAQYRSIRKKYKSKDIVLLAHLGGFKEYEKKYDASKDTEKNRQFFYKNHLGRLGLAKLIETLHPKVCIISEFGEEFRKNRLELTSIFQKVYSDTYFIPADIGLCLNELSQVQLIHKLDPEKNVVHTSFYNHFEADVCERRIDASLHYYKKSSVSEADLREFLSEQYHLQSR